MNPLLKNALLFLALLGGFACIEVPPIDEPTDNPPVVNPPATSGFTLSIDPTQANVLQGGSASLQVSLQRTGGFAESVTVGLVNPPGGISAQSVTVGAGSTSATLTVLVSSSAQPGVQVLTVRGSAGSVSKEVSLSLTVTRLGDLVVQWASPSQSKVYVRDSVQLQVGVEGGTADTIELLKGTEVLARLAGPSYQYTWDVSEVAEGEYLLSARATRGGSTFTSTARTVLVDRTAPQVASQLPQPGAAYVSVRDSFVVSFDEALKDSSLTDSSVVLSTASAGGIAKVLTLSADGRTLTISPSAPLTPPASVTVTLGTATAPVTDLAGNALRTSSAWTFTVPTWLPMGGALSAQSGNTPAEDVAMKVDADGNPVVAWSEADGSSTKNIHVRRWNGTSWVDVGSALSAFAEAGTHAEKPALVLDAEGKPVVVWTERTSAAGTTTGLYGSRWTGTSWQSLPALPAPSSVASFYDVVGVFDGMGSLLVSATRWNEGVYEILLYRLLSAATGWESVAGLKSYVAPLLPSLVADMSGNWFLSQTFIDWDGQKEYRAIAVQRRYVTATQATSWTQLGSSVASPAHNHCGRASMALNGQGRLHLSWRESSDTESNIHAAFWNGTSWSMLGGVISADTVSNGDPSMLMGNDGNPMVAWSGYASPEQAIRVSRWDGSGWRQVGSPLSAVTGATTSGLRPVLGLDKSGQPLVAWHESDGSVTNVYVHRYNH